jgi:hypothetical protein
MLGGVGGAGETPAPTRFHAELGEVLEAAFEGVGAENPITVDEQGKRRATERAAGGP